MAHHHPFCEGTIIIPFGLNSFDIILREKGLSVRKDPSHCWIIFYTRCPLTSTPSEYFKIYNTVINITCGCPVSLFHNSISQVTSQQYSVIFKCNKVHLPCKQNCLDCWFVVLNQPRSTNTMVWQWVSEWWFNTVSATEAIFTVRTC